MPPRLVCVGVGPGDTELLTLKAVNALRGADVIFSPTSRLDRPSLAFTIVEPILRERQSQPEIVPLLFPMTKDAARLRASWERNAMVIAEKLSSKRLGVYAVVGDPTLYSTFTYIHRELRSKHPEVTVELVPGITSMTACAIRAGLSLAEGGDVVSIIPAAYELAKYRRVIEGSDTIVVVKNGRRFKDVVNILQESNFPADATIAYGHDCTLPEGEMKTIKLSDALKMEAGEKYFSVLIVKRKEGSPADDA